MQSAFGLAAVVVALLAACSSDDDAAPAPASPPLDGDASADGATPVSAPDASPPDASAPDVSAPDVSPPPSPFCTALHHAPAKPNVDAYRMFATDADAVADAKVRLPKLTIPLNAPPLPAGHPNQPVAEAVVAELFTVFRQLYPDETEGLETPPRVVILDDATPNAFAFWAYPTDADPKSPYYIAFTDASFSQAVVPDEFRGLVAHEMGHLLLRNVLVEPSYERHYLGAGDEAAVFGAYQADDAAVAARVATVGQKRSLVGEIGVAELDGLPLSVLDGDTPASYPRFFAAAYAKYKAQSSDAAACVRYEAGLDLLAHMFDPYVDLQDRSLSLDAAARAAIAAKAIATRTDLVKCVPVVARSYAAMYQEIYGTAVALNTDESALDATYAGSDYFAEMLELTARTQSQLAGLEASTDLPPERIRVYRYEEDADDVSARVLHALGKDPRGVASFFLHVSAGLSYTERCIAGAKAGTVPFFGDFRDVHPSLCWRYWNLDRIAGALATCAR